MCSALCECVLSVCLLRCVVQCCVCCVVCPQVDIQRCCSSLLFVRPECAKPSCSLPSHPPPAPPHLGGGGSRPSFLPPPTRSASPSPQVHEFIFRYRWVKGGGTRFGLLILCRHWGCGLSYLGCYVCGPSVSVIRSLCMTSPPG